MHELIWPCEERVNKPLSAEEPSQGMPWTILFDHKSIPKPPHSLETASSKS